MRPFEVTVLLNGSLETRLVYSKSTSAAKKLITDQWNKEIIYGAKVIKVVSIDDTRADELWDKIWSVK